MLPKSGKSLPVEVVHYLTSQINKQIKFLTHKISSIVLKSTIPI